MRGAYDIGTIASYIGRLDSYHYVMSITEDPQFARVICPVHGVQGVSRRNYNEQQTRPEAEWECPVCGAASEFDQSDWDSKHQ